MLPPTRTRSNPPSGSSSEGGRTSMLPPWRSQLNSRTSCSAMRHAARWLNFAPPYPYVSSSSALPSEDTKRWTLPDCSTRLFPDLVRRRSVWTVVGGMPANPRWWPSLPLCPPPWPFSPSFIRPFFSSLPPPASPPAASLSPVPPPIPPPVPPQVPPPMGRADDDARLPEPIRSSLYAIISLIAPSPARYPSRPRPESDALCPRGLCSAPTCGRKGWG